MIEPSEVTVISNNANTSSTHSSSQIVSINTASLIPQKLSKGGNYSIWSSQITNLFLGYDLIGFIRQDRLLLLAIQIVVAGPVGSLISCCKSAKEVSQEGKSIYEFMQSIKTIINDLAMIGHDLSDGEIIVHMLNGLTNDYKELKAALLEKLLDYETSLNHLDSMKEESSITAQYSQKQHNKKCKNNNSNTSQNKPTYKGNHSGHNWNNDSHFQQNSYGNHGNQNYSNNSYKQGFSSNRLNQNWRSPFNGSQSRVVCQLCDKLGSIVDYVASHHITLDLQNLSIHSKYGGNEDIMIGDGSNYGGILNARQE
ncbi:hypothetical protein Pfo_022559 [Paulownia fortunei]|nr:hypothetical protein Pfo_022559 [Paulownia fortunei]